MALHIDLEVRIWIDLCSRIHFECSGLFVHPSVTSVRNLPLPVADLGQVLAIQIDVKLVLDQLVLAHLL